MKLSWPVFVFFIALMLGLSFIGAYGIHSYYTLRKPQQSVRYNQTRQYIACMKIFPAYDLSCTAYIIGDSHAAYCNWIELTALPICNRGVPSDVMQGIYSRIGEAARSKAKVVFIEGGANDIGNDVPRDTTMKYLRLSIAEVEKSGKRAVIINVPKVENGYPDWEQFNRKADTLNSLFGSLGKTCISVSLKHEDYQNDHIHLTGSGYKKLGAIMMPIAIEEMSKH